MEFLLQMPISDIKYKNMKNKVNYYSDSYPAQSLPCSTDCYPHLLSAGDEIYKGIRGMRNGGKVKDLVTGKKVSRTRLIPQFPRLFLLWSSMWTKKDISDWELFH